MSTFKPCLLQTLTMALVFIKQAASVSRPANISRALATQHVMMTLCYGNSALQAICEGKSPIIGGCPSQKVGNVELLLAWTSCWTNHRSVSDLRHHGVHLTSLGCIKSSLILSLLMPGIRRLLSIRSHSLSVIQGIPVTVLASCPITFVYNNWYIYIWHTCFVFIILFIFITS